jgi:hypothetical protein
MQEDIAGRKEEEAGSRKQEEGSGNSIIDSVNSGSGPDYQIFIQLGWAPW